jgi:hypothetical protein
MPIRYKCTATIIRIIFWGTINRTIYLTWTTITKNVNIFMKDTYLRGPRPRRRILFVHIFPLSRQWCYTEVRLVPHGYTRQIITAVIYIYIYIYYKNDTRNLQCHYCSVMEKNGMGRFACFHNTLKLVASEGGMELARNTPSD